MSKRTVELQTVLPDQVVLNPIQQKRLAALAGIDEKEIAGKNIAQLSDQLKFRIEPHIFLFKKICGKVVKKDPVTGVEYPVPFATVIVEDTDCNGLIYHPINNPWSWHFPLFCTREKLATVKTDACGNFCVWIPLFDIDRILHWRRERFCFPIIFRRPILKDLVEKIKWPPIPNPPDPGPIREFASLSSVLNTIGGAKADTIKNKIARKESLTAFGAINTGNEEHLNERLFDHEVPPPLALNFRKAISGSNIIASRGASAVDAIRADIAGKLGFDPAGKELADFDPANYRGPFYRCIDVFVAEWQYLFDIPDITFRVTQDTNGDGIEETIYSESYSDVRWDEENLSDIKLQASSIAKESRGCQTPSIPCGDAPDILFAGLMPLRNTDYFDDTTGYALRPNRPIPTGLPGGTQYFPGDPQYVRPETPFLGALQFYGCVEVQNAVYYRIHQSVDNGATYTPVTGLGWNNFVLSTPIPITADANGWYAVQPINPVTLSPVPRSSLEFSNLLLDWPTPLNAKSLLKIEIGNASKAHIAESSSVAIVSDNIRPSVILSKWAWKYEGESDASLRDLDAGNCPMIKRGIVPQNIELVFEVTVSSNHLRDASIGTAGCGDGSFAPIADAQNDPAHWYTTPGDNFIQLYQRYRLAAASRPGCYSFSCTANGRAMNPSGSDNGNLLPTDWFYNPVYSQTQYSISVAVVNESL